MNDWPTVHGETPFDLSGLKPKGVTTRTELNKLEFRNIAKAYEKYLASPLTGSGVFGVSWMMRIHRDMFCDVWRWAGQQRQQNLNLGVDFFVIGQKLAELESDLKFWLAAENQDRLEQGAQVHYRAVSIHPFENGNGRWARLLTTLWMRKTKQPEIRWPEADMQSGLGNVRSDYIEALKRADSHDFGPLTEFHRRHQLPTGDHSITRR